MSLTLLFDIVIIGNILSFLIFFWLYRTSSKFFGQFVLNVWILTMKIFFSFCWRLLFCVGSSVTRLNYFHQLVAISHHKMTPHLLLHNFIKNANCHYIITSHFVVTLVTRNQFPMLAQCCWKQNSSLHLLLFNFHIQMADWRHNSILDMITSVQYTVVHLCKATAYQ